MTLLGAFYTPAAAAAPPLSAKYEGRTTKDEAGAVETFGLGLVRGQETGAQQDNRAQLAKALTLPSPDLPSAGARRGVSGVFVAPGLLQAPALTLTFADGRGTSQSARQAGALSLPSPEGRGVSAKRDDEILVDQLAEYFAAEAVGRGASLYETGLPLRLAVADVIALWPA